MEALMESLTQIILAMMHLSNISIKTTAHLLTVGLPLTLRRPYEAYMSYAIHQLEPTATLQNGVVKGEIPFQRILDENWSKFDRILFTLTPRYPQRDTNLAWYRINFIRFQQAACEGRMPRNMTIVIPRGARSTFREKAPWVYELARYEGCTDDRVEYTLDLPVGEPTFNPCFSKAFGELNLFPASHMQNSASSQSINA